MNILLTGGAGFIGSALVRHLIQHTQHRVMNIDCLSYAANIHSIACISGHERYHFEQVDICHQARIKQIMYDFQPESVIHLAAETHVDRSIINPDIFVTSNILGTQVLLECSRQYWQTLGPSQKTSFRFLYVSTDEVYGSRDGDESVDETAPYLPNSPYAASKAAATHLVRAYAQTYQLPTLTTFSSNTYGPWQYPEKLIPITIQNALNLRPVEIYGQGKQRRDWLYVEDHVSALMSVLFRGQVGEGYNISAGVEMDNLQLVNTLCQQLDQLYPASNGQSYQQLIRFVEDRPAHDQRYGINDDKIRQQLDWRPQHDFTSALETTLRWHLQQFTEKNSTSDG